MDRIQEKVENFKPMFCNMWRLDIKHAIEVADEVGIDEEKLFDLCEEFCKDCGNGLDIMKVDVNYIIYDHILQNARQVIE